MKCTGSCQLPLQRLQRQLWNKPRSLICDNVMPRCAWATTEPAITYHDAEWGVPVHHDRLLFEFLILEGAQAGLSWSTILNKREGYRKAFAGFDAEKIARFGKRDLTRLMNDASIVRNRLNRFGAPVIE